MTDARAPALLTDWQPERAGPLTAARAFAVVMSGPLVLLAGAVTSAALVLRALVRRERPPRLAAAGVASTVACARLVRSRTSSWNTRCCSASSSASNSASERNPDDQGAVLFARRRTGCGRRGLARSRCSARSPAAG
jgi:hypothetical protein